MKVSICICIRNNENYVRYIDKLFSKVEQNYTNIDFEYYFYENNSNDSTKEEINAFMKNRKGKVWMENLPNNKMKSGISLERGIHMATIRNGFKKYHGNLDSDYVFLIDDDVIFLPDTIQQFIDTFVSNKDDNIVMVTPFCICNITLQKRKLLHYYDSFAVITNDDICFTHHGNTCLYNKCLLCHTKRSIMHNKSRLSKRFTNKHLFAMNTIIPVKSAFGSFACLPTEIYNKVNWGKSICEHHSFCEEVNKYGKIVINSNIKTITTDKEYRDYELIEETLFHLTEVLNELT